jgi:hypothetical protein
MYYGDDLLSNHLCAITDNMQFVEQLSVALFSYEWQDTNQ